MSNKIDVTFLKDKTDAECRELTIHYYRRARKAEEEVAKQKEETSYYYRRYNDLSCKVADLLDSLD